ncbi:nicotinate-nucleotide adenylyltransferase, partial [Candidatus Nomurabacteria bacterium]|nr:nicotinate-nucleotide adenylyltransferase [Candidatus Nomurabacteria bacterium]
MNRVGLFGGTFDPPHIGHRLILQAAAATKFFDKIIVVPAAVPPRKSIINVSMSSYRYEMTNIMVDNYDFDTLVTVSDIELRRKDKSYTID